MKLKSRFFDSVRSSRGGRGKSSLPKREPVCQWEGCEKPSRHRAPMGREREGKFYSFCLAHVREYNRQYNYFSNMNDEEIQELSEQPVPGDRPTWNQNDSAFTLNGLNGSRPQASSARFFRIRPSSASGGRAGEDSTSFQARKPHPNELRSLETLGLSYPVSPKQIREQYKALVKACHPDLHGGDRSLEDRLKRILRAYHHLKRAGWTQQSLFQDGYDGD